MEYGNQLFVMVMELVAVMVLAGGAAAYLFRNVFNVASILLGFTISIVMVFVNSAIAATNNVPLIFIGAAIFGASVGADICGFALAVAYYNDLEPKDAYQAVGVGMVVVGLATAAAAFVGIMSGINFQGLQVVMAGGLFLLIGIGIVSFFVRYNKITELIIAFGASIFWIIYLVVDFNSVVNKIPTWSNAMQIAMKIYLDMVNLLIQFIKIYLMTKKD